MNQSVLLLLLDTILFPSNRDSVTSSCIFLSRNTAVIMKCVEHVVTASDCGTAGLAFS